MMAAIASICSSRGQAGANGPILLDVTEAVLIKLQTSKHGLTLTADQKPTKFGEAFTNGQRHGDSIQLQVLQV